MCCFTDFFSSRRRHTRYWRDWSSDVCSSDLAATRRLTGALFAWADLGGTEVKGLPGPVHAWRALGESGVESRFEALRTGHAGPLVGDRKSVVEGKSVDLGGRRIIKNTSENYA